MKIRKILIANRGEIACRIIKTSKALGIKTVALYSEADSNSLHKGMADEAVFIGASPANESYLVVDKIINAAKETGADAIHPGYGFLSENSNFVKRVLSEGLIFIGPDAEAISHLGSKVQSRITMMNSNVPVIPGMKSSSNDIKEFEVEAGKIGYPVLIKASSGGGGKGMRVVHKSSEIREALDSSKREALSSFGDDDVFLEKYIESPRHIEIQVARDKHGNAIHLFERECSIQRRHQKIIEETPSYALNSELRMKMGESAIKAIEAVGYYSVATVEFLLDSNGNYYFLEVNTRIQVEHPITEMTTGIDLVQMQIEIAEGKKLSHTQEEVKQNGHAIECRIYAEDADNNFMPDTGRILYLNEPNGENIRYDSGIKQEDEVSIFYDPILAKLIVWEENRDKAIEKMLYALKEHILLGLKTSTNFMYNVLSHKDFKSGKTYTNFIDSNAKDLFDKEEERSGLEKIAHLFKDVYLNRKFINKGNSIWYEIGNWDLIGRSDDNLTVKLIDNNTADVNYKNNLYKVCFSEDLDNIYINIDGYYFTFLKSNQYDVAEENVNEDRNIVKSHTPGKVIDVLVNEGDAVKEGDKLIIVEAMKMETAFYSSINGVVKSVFTSQGNQVDSGDELIIVEKKK